MVSRELRTARRLHALHCVIGSYTLSRSTARSLDSDQGRAEAKWSLNPDPKSASDADPRSRVESPNIIPVPSYVTSILELRSILDFVKQTAIIK